jgi:hypothetical protein
MQKQLLLSFVSLLLWGKPDNIKAVSSLLFGWFVGCFRHNIFNWPILFSPFEVFFCFLVSVCYVSYIVIFVPTQYFCCPLLKGFHDTFGVFAIRFNACNRLNFDQWCTVSFHHVHVVQTKVFWHMFGSNGTILSVNILVSTLFVVTNLVKMFLQLAQPR